MTTPDIWTQITEIFREVFDEEDLIIHAETTAADVGGWTSLTHVEMILQVELAFGIQFNTGEITGLGNAGDLAALIEKRMPE